MKILFACRKFDGVVGGVERMSTTLMNEMVARGHDVSLFTWDDNLNAKSFYPIDSKINWMKLAMGNPAKKAGLFLMLKRALKVRKFLKDLSPDVVLGFQEGSFVTLKVYGLGLGIPMICAIRESPFRYKYIQAKPPFWMSCQLFRMAAVVTVQIDRYREAFPRFLQARIKAIPNHVMPAEKLAQPAAESTSYMLLSTGRLSPEKNHAVLVKAFALIADAHPNWSLVIVGRGGQSDNLQSMANALPQAVGSRIHLAGASDDIPSWLVKAHIFCLPSRWEGFPNSLAEAMAHGLPSVGFQECDGVCDLIEDGKTGLLISGADDAQALANGLARLMKDSNLREKIGEAAYAQSKNYAPQKIFDMWESLLKSVVKS